VLYNHLSKFYDKVMVYSHSVTYGMLK